jgi:hypothetical protein
MALTDRLRRAVSADSGESAGEWAKNCQPVTVSAVSL